MFQALPGSRSEPGLPMQITVTGAIQDSAPYRVTYRLPVRGLLTALTCQRCSRSNRRVHYSTGRSAALCRQDVDRTVRQFHGIVALLNAVTVALPADGDMTNRRCDAWPACPFRFTQARTTIPSSPFL